MSDPYPQESQAVPWLRVAPLRPPHPTSTSVPFLDSGLGSCVHKGKPLFPKEHSQPEFKKMIRGWPTLPLNIFNIQMEEALLLFDSVLVSKFSIKVCSVTSATAFESSLPDTKSGTCVRHAVGDPKIQLLNHQWLPEGAMNFPKELGLRRQLDS